MTSFADILVTQQTKGPTKLEKIDSTLNLKGVEKKLSNPKFRENAKPEVVATEEARQAEMKEQIAKLEEGLKAFD